MLGKIEDEEDSSVSMTVVMCGSLAALLIAIVLLSRYMENPLEKETVQSTTNTAVTLEWSLPVQETKKLWGEETENTPKILSEEYIAGTISLLEKLGREGSHEELREFVCSAKGVICPPFVESAMLQN